MESIDKLQERISLINNKEKYNCKRIFLNNIKCIDLLPEKDDSQIATDAADALYKESYDLKTSDDLSEINAYLYKKNTLRIIIKTTDDKIECVSNNDKHTDIFLSCIKIIQLYSDSISKLRISATKQNKLPILCYMPSLTCLFISKCIFESIPDLSPFPNLKYLRISNNLIEYVTEITSYSQLIELDLSCNIIKKFDVPNLFEKLPEMKLLDLESNKLIFIRINGSKYRSSLTDLNLSKNSIEVLSVINVPIEILILDNNNIKNFHHGYVKCPSLKVLKMNKNKMKKITMNDFPNLQILDLVDNEFKKISLKNLPKLQLLKMSNTYMKEINDLLEFTNSSSLFWKDAPYTFELPNNVIYMDLNCNLLSSLPSMYIYRKLTKCNLSRNLLTDISGLIECLHLKELNLSHNRLNDDVLNVLFMINNNGFIELNLEKNQLTTFSFQIKVNKLNLSYNKIKKISIPENLDISFIKSLNLSHNFLTDIMELLFRKLDCSILDISFNMLTTLPEIIEMKYLTELNISHNHILFIPYIENNSSLEILDVSFNKIDYIPHFLLKYSNFKLHGIILEHKKYNRMKLLYQGNDNIKVSKYIHEWISDDKKKNTLDITMEYYEFKQLDKLIYYPKPINYDDPLLRSINKTEKTSYGIFLGDLYFALYCDVSELNDNDKYLYNVVIKDIQNSLIMTNNQKLKNLSTIKMFLDRSCNTVINSQCFILLSSFNFFEGTYVHNYLRKVHRKLKNNTYKQASKDNKLLDKYFKLINE